MEYTWDIIDYSTKDEVNQDGVTLADSVVKITWRKKATALNGKSSTYIGISYITAENTSESDFIPHGNITKETLLSWVQNSMDESEETVINDTLQKKIAAQAETKRKISA